MTIKTFIFLFSNVFYWMVKFMILIAYPMIIQWYWFQNFFFMTKKKIFPNKVSSQNSVCWKYISSIQHNNIQLFNNLRVDIKQYYLACKGFEYRVWYWKLLDNNQHLY